MYRYFILILFGGFLAGCITNGGRSPSLDAWSANLKTIDVAPNDIVRIVTPFPDPRVITTASSEIERNQHVLYVLTSGDQPITMFVTEEGNEQASISLTLVPKVGGVREVDVVALAEGSIRAASAPTSKQAVGTTQSEKRVVEPWDGRPCKLCRGSDDNGSDYGGDDKGW